MEVSSPEGRDARKGMRGVPGAWRPRSTRDWLRDRGPACLGIRFSVGCALILSMIIQAIRLYPSGAIWTDGPSNVSN